jgi:hypothetical protein
MIVIVHWSDFGMMGLFILKKREKLTVNAQILLVQLFLFNLLREIIKIGIRYMINVCVKEVIVITLNKRFWVKIHLKLCVLFFPFLLLGCATNDSNSRLVRFWNDGFIMTEKRSAEFQDCSIQANQMQEKNKLTNDERYKVYLNCRKNKGY